MFHITSYPNQYIRSKLMFDAEVPIVSEMNFMECEWKKEFYRRAKEVILLDMSESLA